MDSESSLALLLVGPAGGIGLYWFLYRYYRNTDKSHAFEHETKVIAKPVTGSDHQIDTNNGTRNSRISGDNMGEYRHRVGRMKSDDE